MTGKKKNINRAKAESKAKVKTLVNPSIETIRLSYSGGTKGQTTLMLRQQCMCESVLLKSTWSSVMCVYTSFPTLMLT